MSVSNLIPIVDFGKCSIGNENCSRENLFEVGKELLKAFSEVGFVYLKNCGITDEYINRIHQTTEKFFTSSEADKQRYQRQGKVFGYMGLAGEKTNSEIPSDYKELFNVDAESFTRGQNEWPDDIAPEFSTTMLSFMERANLLTMRILNALGLAMDLKDEHYFEKCHKDIHTANTFTTARTLYYPPVEAKDLVPGQVRLGEHADYTSISILFQDSVGGLQVKNVDGEFVDARPIDGTALINIGETLKMWTCGALKSTKHRIVMPVDDRRCQKVRRSLVYFVHADHDAAVNAPLLYKDGSKNREQPDEIITGFEFVSQRLNAMWNDLKD